MRTIHLKRFSFIAVAFVLSIFFLASCNKDGASVYVPKEAYTVANYNVKNIVEKCDIENIQKLSVFKTLRSELKRESYEADQTLDQILSDPASCGLDLREDVLMWTSEDFPFSAVAIMHDKDDFEKTIKNIVPNITIRERVGYSYIEIERYVILAWDKKKAIMMSCYDDDIMVKADKIMAIEKENSIVNNENFKEFWKKRGDFGSYMDISQFLNNPIFKRDLKNIPQQYLTGLDNAGVYMIANFENGKLNINWQAINIDNQYINDLFSQKFNNDLLNYMPEKALAAATLTINPSVVIDIIDDVDRHILKEKLANGHTVRDLVDCFKGSFAASISDIIKDEHGNYMPTFTIVADLNNSNLAKSILAASGEKETNGYYTIEGNIYVAIKNDIFIITNNLSCMNGNSNGLRDVADEAKSNVFAYINFNINDYPSWLKDNLGTDSRNLFNDLAGTIILKSNGNNGYDLTLSVPSGNDNILAYTIKLIDKYFYKFENIADDIYNIAYPRHNNHNYYYDYEEETDELSEELDDLINDYAEETYDYTY